MAVNPFVPNLADYRSFVYGMSSKAASVYPTAAGTVSAGTISSLTDQAANWKANAWIGCVMFDVTQSFGGIVISNTSTVVSFEVYGPGSVQLIDSSGAFVMDSGGNQITGVGNAQGLAPAPGDRYLIVQASLSESLAIAIATVNETLSCVAPLLYTKAVYNLALDRLINFGVDVEGQTWLQDLRTDFGVLSIESGVVAAASDQGTSGSMLVPDQFRTFTLDDLQLMKTPFGRQYLSIAQNYGSTLFGVS